MAATTSTGCVRISLLGLKVHGKPLVYLDNAASAQKPKAVLDRFFSKFDGAVRIDINDAGATPGAVMLRLEQAVEVIEQ